MSYLRDTALVVLLREDAFAVGAWGSCLDRLLYAISMPTGPKLVLVVGEQGGS
jgi:hypothetical protein